MHVPLSASIGSSLLLLLLLLLLFFDDPSPLPFTTTTTTAAGGVDALRGKSDNNCMSSPTECDSMEMHVHLCFICFWLNCECIAAADDDDGSNLYDFAPKSGQQLAGERRSANTHILCRPFYALFVQHLFIHENRDNDLGTLRCMCPFIQRM